MCKLLPEKISQNNILWKFNYGRDSRYYEIIILDVKGYSGYVESLRMLKYFGVKHQEV